MSSFSSLLDKNGNINTAVLSRELTAALDFDVKYKQVDNMKKRAVRTATSYDEFRAMVSCAHLKKLSRKEVESLSDVKKGWKKGGHGANNSSGGLLDLTSSSSTGTKKGKGSSLKITTKPKTSMELERNLRRIETDTEKWSYLQKLGVETVLALLGRAVDTDVIESVLKIVLANAVALSENEGIHSESATAEVSAAVEAIASKEDAENSNTNRSNSNQAVESEVPNDMSKDTYALDLSSQEGRITPSQVRAEKEDEEGEEDGQGGEIAAGVVWLQLLSTEVSQMSLTLRFAERNLVQGIVHYLQQQQHQHVVGKSVYVPEELVAFYQRHL